MAWVKIEYGSSNNISVQGTDYIEIEDELLNEDGTVPDKIIEEVWIEAVCEYMSDTFVGQVDAPGDDW